MNLIEFKLKQFLEKYARGEVQIPPEYIEEYAENIKRVASKTRKDKFTIRLSNVGKPLCQLQLEQQGVKGEGLNYTNAVRFAIGDNMEQWLVMMLRAAGVDVRGYQVPVKFNVEGVVISGTLDIQIEDKIWDIKTASKYGFTKFSSAGGIDSILETDTFGYLSQGFGYATAEGKKFGGWIVLNKNDGDIAVMEVPDHTHDKYKDKALDLIKKNVKSLINNEPFKKLFSEQDEKFYGKLTGNKIIGYPCYECAFKKTCWPQAVYLPSVTSKAKSPKLQLYTYVDPKYNLKDKNNEKEDNSGYAQ